MWPSGMFYLSSIVDTNLEHSYSFCINSSGVTRRMVIPGPETKVIGESGSGGGLGAALRKV